MAIFYSELQRPERNKDKGDRASWMDSLVPVPQGPGVLLSIPSDSPEAPTRSPLCLSRSKEASVTCTEGGPSESQDFYNPIGSGTAHRPIRMKHRAWRCWRGGVGELEGVDGWQAEGGGSESPLAIYQSV